LKKRTKKLLPIWFRASLSGYASGGESARAKVFCFFFQKEVLPFFVWYYDLTTSFTLFGTAPALIDALAHAGLTPAPPPAATLLINFTPDAEAAIASGRNFADAIPPGQEALVVNILHGHLPDDWPGARAAASLFAFTRHAALAWAPRRIRVNAIGLGVSPALPDQPPDTAARAASPAPAAPATASDIAATILAMWRFPSMTGQLIRLGAP